MCLDYVYRSKKTQKLISRCPQSKLFGKECLVGYKIFHKVRTRRKTPSQKYALKNMWCKTSRYLSQGWIQNTVFRHGYLIDGKYLSCDEGSRKLYPCGLHIFMDKQQAELFARNEVPGSRFQALVVMPVYFYKQDILCSGRQDRSLWSLRPLNGPITNLICMIFVTQQYFIKAKDYKKAIG